MARLPAYKDEEKITLKDPPENLLPMAECVAVNETEHPSSQMSFFQQVKQGKASIATPLKTPEPEMEDEEEEIDFQIEIDKAKALSLKELDQALPQEETPSESDTVLESEIQVNEDTRVSNLTLPLPETQPQNEEKGSPSAANTVDLTGEDESSRVSHNYNTRARKSINPTESK